MAVCLALSDQRKTYRFCILASALAIVLTELSEFQYLQLMCVSLALTNIPPGSPVSPALKQFGRGTVLFCLLHVVGISSSMFVTANSISLWISELSYTAFGLGSVKGLSQFGWTPLLLSVFVVIPWGTIKEATVQCWLFVLLQLSASSLLALTQGIVSEPLYFAVLLIPVVFAADERIKSLTAPFKARELAVSGGVQFISVFAAIVFAVSCLKTAVELRSYSVSPSDGARVLVLKTEDDDDSMGAYFPPGTSSVTEAEYFRHLDSPVYDGLFSRLLPASGFDLSVRGIDSVTVRELEESDVIVAICLHRTPPKGVSNKIQQLVHEGKASLLLAGDHTDIQGVMGPFNELAQPYGVSLNYDSIIPFNGWQKSLQLFPHPLFGKAAMLSPSSISDLGISVGASLSISPGRARPLIVSSAGYTDRGTPDAPEIAGLGDRMYNPGEAIGGQILAAEALYGAGRVVCFGDTAFMQNGSVMSNAEFLFSLFHYLTSPVSTANQIFRNQVTILAGLTVCILSLFAFRVLPVLLVAVLAVAGSILVSVNVGQRELVSCLLQGDKYPIVVLNRDRSRCIGEPDCTSVDSMIQVSGNIIVLEGRIENLVDLFLQQERIDDSLVLLAPRERIDSTNREQILEFVSKGGGLLCAAGFHESRSVHSLLSKVGCEITPVILGGGHQLTSVDPTMPTVPPSAELWGLKLSAEWDHILEAFGRPVLARRNFGKGKVCVFADSFALTDHTIQNDTTFKTNAGVFPFYARLFGWFFRHES
ncbi:MAG: hypothetical protein R3C59_28840 [Planctomycetaceae bacterium]